MAGPPMPPHNTTGAKCVMPIKALLDACERDLEALQLLNMFQPEIFVNKKMIRAKVCFFFKRCRFHHGELGIAQRGCRPV